MILRFEGGRCPQRLNSAVIHPCNTLSYSFRIHFALPTRIGIDAENARHQIENVADLPPIILRSPQQNESIGDARELVLEGSGYESTAEANQAGEIVLDAVMLSFARLQKGADFGFRKPQGAFTTKGLEWLEQQMGQRVLQGGLGLKIYETEPRPRFATTEASLRASSPVVKLANVLKYAVAHQQRLTDQERVSFELYNASFFESPAKARFLLLIMAVEVLLKPRPRPPEVRQHVDELITLTRESDKLDQRQKDSLLGSLNWLHDESISQAGRRLAEQRLGGRKYEQMTPPKFFTRCYSLRSKLVHGVVPPPTRSEVGTAAANLEVFVSHLLSGDLLELDINKDV